MQRNSIRQEKEAAAAAAAAAAASSTSPGWAGGEMSAFQQDKPHRAPPPYPQVLCYANTTTTNNNNAMQRCNTLSIYQDLFDPDTHYIIQKRHEPVKTKVLKRLMKLCSYLVFLSFLPLGSGWSSGVCGGKDAHDCWYGRQAYSPSTHRSPCHHRFHCTKVVKFIRIYLYLVSSKKNQNKNMFLFFPQR